jgi:hypothetical protein
LSTLVIQDKGVIAKTSISTLSRSWNYQADQCSVIQVLWPSWQESLQHSHFLLRSPFPPPRTLQSKAPIESIPSTILSPLPTQLQATSNVVHKEQSLMDRPVSSVPRSVPKEAPVTARHASSRQSHIVTMNTSSKTASVLLSSLLLVPVIQSSRGITVYLKGKHYVALDICSRETSVCR